MENSYDALLNARAEGPEGVLVQSLSSDQSGLRVTQSQLRFGSIAKLKQEFHQPPNVVLENDPTGEILWLRNERGFQVWSGKGFSQSAGPKKTRGMKTRFRRCLRID